MIIPEPWRVAFQVVKNIHPEAVMAGGCLRDLDNGRPVKDIDIFVQGVPNASALSDHLGINLLPVVQEVACEYIPSMSDVAAVYEEVPAIIDGLPALNIIGLNMEVTPTRVLDRIDIGLCRIAFDGERIIYGVGYLADKVNRTMTVLRCDNDAQYERTRQRFQRLKDKYEGFQFVDTRPCRLMAGCFA